MLYDTITHQLQTPLPGVPTSQLTNLALLVATAAEMQHGQFGALVRALPLARQAASRVDPPQLLDPLELPFYNLVNTGQHSLTHMFKRLLIMKSRQHACGSRLQT